MGSTLSDGGYSPFRTRYILYIEDKVTNSHTMFPMKAPHFKRYDVFASFFRGIIWRWVKLFLQFATPSVGVLKGAVRAGRPFRKGVKIRHVSGDDLVRGSDRFLYFLRKNIFFFFILAV
ncbi:unnamed protein product [Larinioides sclopetarius]|uniref:Uncharacterized protein n=1 Tax=Larinioides sclopetarius TaxID=280406 RepID=A0AAV1ZNF5_9ARAC